MLIDSHYWKLLSRNMYARKSALIEREEVNGGTMRDKSDKLKEGRFQLTKELKKNKNHHETCPLQKEFPREAAFGGLGWIEPWAIWAVFSVVPALSRRLDQKSPEVSPNLNCSVLLWEIASSWLLPFKNKWSGFQVSVNQEFSFSIQIAIFLQKVWELKSSTVFLHTSLQLCMSAVFTALSWPWSGISAAAHPQWCGRLLLLHVATLRVFFLQWHVYTDR